MRRTIPPVLLLLVALALLAAGCGDDNSNQAATTPTQVSTAPPTRNELARPRKPPQVQKVTLTGSEADIDKRPKVPKGQGAPPKKLIVQDLIVGKGAPAQTNDNLEVQYVGVLFKTGDEFDTSWDGSKHGQPFPFALGQGQVIKGWDRGLVGMKVGGRRKLIIPASLGYGASGSGSAIPPNSALIFDVDLTNYIH
jgi:peptidylprolyl isomerase